MVVGGGLWLNREFTGGYDLTILSINRYCSC